MDRDDSDMPLSLSLFLCLYSGEVVFQSKALPVGSLCLRPPAYIALLFFAWAGT